MTTTTPNPNTTTHGRMSVTVSERLEWSRCAQAAYGAGRNDIGHRMSGAASIRNADTITISTYDELMGIYRAWLMFGTWPEV